MMNEHLPDIYLFNPTCEYAIANGSANWQPNQILQKMESDLSSISMFFAGENDLVLVDRIPSSNFIHSFSPLNMALPRFILKNDVSGNQAFIQIPKNELRPWGWSPAAHKFLSPLKPSCPIEFKQSPVASWVEMLRELYSRKFALKILQQLQNTLHPDFILTVEETPVICKSKSDFEAAINRWGKIMVKAPWSSSGRGLQPVTKSPVHPKVWEKLMGIVNEQGYAIAEPLLNKVADLALQFELKNGKVKFLGISNFYTNNKGQYEGNWLNGLPLKTEKAIADFAEYAVDQIKETLAKTIENSELAQHYEGVFGVDTLIYKDEENTIKINPCLEINIRYTMGLLSLRLEKLIHPGAKATFRIFYKSGTSFNSFKEEMESKYQLKISDNKIESGFFALTEATETTAFGAYLLAGSEF